MQLCFSRDLTNRAYTPFKWVMTVVTESIKHDRTDPAKVGSKIERNGRIVNGYQIS